MSSGAGDAAFTGSIPEVYERLMVPMIFAEPARLLAAAVLDAAPVDVLEVAAGTGVLTRLLERAGGVQVVATDLNAPMLRAAEQRSGSGRVTWQVADATDLPFPDGSFDAVACQFGVMFFPDRVQGYDEARRVLRPGGLLAFNTWDRIERNGIAETVTDALAAAVPEADLAFMRRTPHGYFEPDRVVADLVEAGLTAIDVEEVDGTSRSTTADAAIAYCQGTPLRGEIERCPGLTVERATAIAGAGLAARYGEGSFEAPMRWLQVTARRPG
ncbi:methyltransferase domain-containing protein [Nocardioides sp. W3-2-3]|uniref:class I SAM-dependent methyltransferase n=1 Tax=Nocardioides convexus TaxID=2712224 RepID=UPI0024182C31|nr:methyltransferase domain-containing protein [Nocardioides convexus]NHA01946.1 methyltransferase domain-containing protein [Nocardioides convexus]